MPVGVAYHPIDDETNAKAQKLLEQALAREGAHRLDDLIDVRHRKAHTLIAGNFISSSILIDPDYDASDFPSGFLKYELTKEITVDGPIVVAHDKPQRKELSRLLSAHLPAGAPDRIRKPTKEELALIWRLISWDIGEPIFIAEWGKTKYVFDAGIFDHSMRLEWVENLSEPCFSLHQDNKQLTSCYCMVVGGEGLQLEVLYAKRPELECSAHDHTLDDLADDPPKQ